MPEKFEKTTLNSELIVFGGSNYNSQRYYWNFHNANSWNFSSANERAAVIDGNASSNRYKRFYNAFFVAKKFFSAPINFFFALLYC